MTHHYVIEIISKGLFFKVTYRNKKFKKLEHLRGKLDQKILDSLGKVIPAIEPNIENFNRQWFKKVNYQIETKRESIHTQFLNEWILFFEEHNNSRKPKISGTDVNALKGIKIYLRSQVLNDDEALENWRLILSKWKLLSPFHQKQMDLKYINSKLNVLITEIQQQGASDSDEIARNFKL